MSENSVASLPRRAAPRWWIRITVLAATGVLVIGTLVWILRIGGAGLGTTPAAQQYYNLLVDGFRSGHLSLKQAVPPGLERLRDPYDPVTNARYRYGHPQLFDMSYYHGRLYLYFGVTPALILFWPWMVLTGHALSHAAAVLIFCAAGFVTATGLLVAVWRRYFPEVRVAVVGAGAAALGLANTVPMMLQRPDFWEVPVACGYFLSTLALAAVWRAIEDPARRGRWLAAASLIYGLAVGARPSVLFGGVILFIPLVGLFRRQGTAERRRFPWRPLVAAIIPIALVGLGLMAYNWLRFDNPFELGQRYQLATDRQAAVQHFSLGYLWFNWRLYFLAPMRWSAAFPFVADHLIFTAPPGHALVVENPLSLLVNVPLVWFALALPLVWWKRPADDRRRLRRFLAAATILFLNGAAVICLFYSTSNRYEVDFAPELVWLAVLGVLAVERAGTAWRPLWRRTVRATWIALLAFSIATNLLAAIERGAMEYYSDGRVLLESGHPAEAVPKLRYALRLSPDYVYARIKLGIALNNLGRTAAAISQYHEAIRLKPDEPTAHLNLGVTLAESGRMDEAIREFRRAAVLNPTDPIARFNLGLAFARSGRLPDAIKELRAAVRLAPKEDRPHDALGSFLLRAGRFREAAAEFRAALRLNPRNEDAQTGLEEAEARLP